MLQSGAFIIGMTITPVNIYFAYIVSIEITILQLGQALIRFVNYIVQTHLLGSIYRQTLLLHLLFVTYANLQCITMQLQVDSFSV